MTRRGYLLPMICTALTGSSIFTAGAADTAVGMQDLLSVRASNKIEKLQVMEPQPVVQ